MSELYELGIECPNCERRPPVRLFPIELRLHRKENGNKQTETIKCKCGEVYVVTVKAYHHARPPGRR